MDLSAPFNSNHPLPSLIEDPARMHVGFVVRMTYNTVTVLTNDDWKWRAGGIPQNCFLIAASFDPEKFDETPDSEKIAVLLRARGEAKLPTDTDNFRAIIEHYQKKEAVQAEDEHDGLERVTKSRLQFGGLECHVLGSFYTDGTGQLFMGSDIESFYSVGRLRVYKPTANALAKIVNYMEPRRRAKAESDARLLLKGSLPAPLLIGSVRYTSSNPMQKAEKQDVPVRIQPFDFLARRTGVLGMTRTGKSNTVKSLVAAAATAAKAAGDDVKIGQIIFDVKGEYANANGKDTGSSLAEALGPDIVKRYRGGIVREGFLDFRDNFYRSLTSGLMMLQGALSMSGRNTGSDMMTLINLDLKEPDENSFATAQDFEREHKRWEKRAAIYKCILRKAEYEPARADHRLTFDVGVAVWKQLHAAQAPDCADCRNDPQRTAHAKAMLGDPSAGITLDAGIEFFATIRGINRDTVIRSTTGRPWIDEIEKGLLNLLVGQQENGSPIRSAKVIGDAGRIYHSPTGSEDVARDIYEFLKDGKVVIIDLSIGSESTKKTKSKIIAGYILESALQAMAQEQEPPIIMVYVEEAHNLIGKDADLDDTWPRIAKEGAAMNIGLVYCTQEPSSVHASIMANTENFFVTHLNNDREVKCIGEYNDFSDFADVIKGATDVGFSRIKTLSSSFVIPTQIVEFKPAVVKAAFEMAQYQEGNMPAPAAPGTTA